MKKAIDLNLLTKRYPQRRAFITGAGSGLGREFARVLASEQWRLGLTDIDANRLAETVTMLPGSENERVLYTFDVSDYDQFGSAIHDFSARFGGIDLGINNAGIGCGALFDEITISDFKRTINVDLMGVINGCHHLVPVMKQQGAGHVLNIASAAAFAAAPGMSAYNVAKAGVLSLSETLKAELYDYGVNVSVFMPTYIRTNIGKDCIGTPDKKQLARYLVDEADVGVEEAVREVLLKVQSNDLYIVLPKEARKIWRLKRFFPNRFWGFARDELKRREARLRQASTQGRGPSQH